MDIRFMLIAALLGAVVSLGIASFMFSNRERGFTSSQILMAIFIWGVFMLLAYIYQVVF
jgi:hypothetical protein